MKGQTLSQSNDSFQFHAVVEQGGESETDTAPGAKGRGLVDGARKHPVIACWRIFILCAAARITEYFFIRTDESVLAENFIHKLFGVFLLFVVLSTSKMKWKDIGFVNDHAIGNCGKGIMLACACFAIAYGIECLILYITNHNVRLAFYASGFSLNGEMERQTGIRFVLMCISFAIVLFFASSRKPRRSRLPGGEQRHGFAMNGSGNQGK